MPHAVQRSQIPQRLASGQWNCSVPHWPLFQHHFSCNLDTECAGGEDESHCPYTGHCGQGRLTIADRCYVYVTERQSVSWIRANLSCGQLGSYLVSLNSPQEWDDVTDVLAMRREPYVMYVGLRLTHSSRPH